MSDNNTAQFSRHARIRARRSAVQALYQWDMTAARIKDVINEFMQERDELKKADIDYFRDLLNGTAEKIDDLTAALKQHLDRPIAELDPVERVVLLIGTYELMYHPELPWRVVVNESVELAKMFGAEQSHKYINGVMDKIAREIRAVEIQGAASQSR